MLQPIISELYFHAGFYDYVFARTKDDTDPVNLRKYDEVLGDVRALLSRHPGYKLYVTGHSLGAALATLVSFYFACEADLPKPIMCINYASPRVGDYNFRLAVQHLEETHQLRLVRVV